MSDTCGCCDRPGSATPAPTANRPGLAELAYRVGTHATFFDSMVARLSSAEHPELRALSTRAPADPAIAMLDAWAVVADVLSFYQERIANEGYLRTATERRSVLELARLVGYRPRPGVAASTHLAFTLEETVRDEVLIPAGTRAQSLPGPGDLPQPFETGEPLRAHPRWNRLQPRLVEPQLVPEGADRDGYPIYLRGTGSNLRVADPLLIVFAGGASRLYRVAELTPDTAAGRTRVLLRAWATTPPAAVAAPMALRLGATTDADASAAMAQPFTFMAVAMRGMVTLDAPALADFARRLAAALLDTFRYLADEPPSPRRDQTIDAMLRSLGELRDAGAPLIKQLPPLDVLEPYVALYTTSLDAAVAVLAAARSAPAMPALASVAGIAGALLTPIPPDSLPLRHPAYLARSLGQVYGLGSSHFKQLLIRIEPRYQQINAALAAVGSAAPAPFTVYAMRQVAPLFGHNAQEREPTYQPAIIEDANGEERPNPRAGQLNPPSEWREWDWLAKEDNGTLFLDNAYDRIVPGGYIAVQRFYDPGPNIFGEIAVTLESRSAYGISARSTRITLAKGDAWYGSMEAEKATFDEMIRRTVVYAQSEELPLAFAPRTGPVPDTDQGPDAYLTVELDGLYEGLETGRRLVLVGERADLPGVVESELVLLAAAEQLPPSAFPGDGYRTRLRFANRLRNRYRRETVTIYGNVATATHGETRREVLGSGDGGKTLQRFELRQNPLTYLAAPIAAGALSTLELRVDGLRWHEAPGLAGLSPTDRSYILRADDEQKASVIFGNGVYGARLPTGVENVTAVYRSGIGRAGNVRREQISLLATRPYGVRSVINPLAASGGADPEGRDQARRNAPLAVQSLDRLVSTQDYADFARTFAGVGKAHATMLSDGSRPLVYLTIAGADDAPIAPTSDLYRNLVDALRRQGDPYQPFLVELRELVVMLVRARLRIHPDELWEKVEPRARQALLDHFSFERRELGQDVLLGELLAVLQAVPGVIFVDVDRLSGVPESLARADDPARQEDQLKLLADLLAQERPPEPRLIARLARRSPLTPQPPLPAGEGGADVLPMRSLPSPSGRGAEGEGPAILPAQLITLLPDLPETLLLELLP